MLGLMTKSRIISSKSKPCCVGVAYLRMCNNLSSMSRLRLSKRQAFVNLSPNYSCLREKPHVCQMLVTYHCKLRRNMGTNLARRKRFTASLYGSVTNFVVTTSGSIRPTKQHCFHYLQNFSRIKIVVSHAGNYHTVKTKCTRVLSIQGRL